MPDSQPYQKKRVALVWLWNFLLPGLGLGTLYACGTGAMGFLFWFWVLELFFTRLDVVLFVSTAMSVWGTIEVSRHNQAIEFEEELNGVATLSGKMAAVDNLIDKVSKGLVSAIEDGDTGYALDTLEKKAREAELRLKSMDEKLNAQTKPQVDEITGDSLAALPETLGLAQMPVEYNVEKPITPFNACESASGLMSFAPLFETVEDEHGLSLPLGKEPESLPSARSSLNSGTDLTLSFSPPEEEVNPNEEAIRAWLDTGSGAILNVVSEAPGVVSEVSEAEFAEPSPDTEQSVTNVQTEIAFASAEPAEPADSSQLVQDRESSFLLESSLVLENTIPTVVFETSATDALEIPASLSVAGLDTPSLESTSMTPVSSVPSFEVSSSTDFFNVLSERDRKVTEFVDKLANTIGSATSPQPTIDSAFEFSIPNFESSFSFDFSNALSDVVAEKDTASTASKGSKHCQRCGSDRQSEFSFCLKCGISFST